MGVALPRHYIVGIILFVLVTTTCISMIGEFKKYDDSFIDYDKYSQFNRSFNKLNEVNESISGLKTAFTESDTQFGLFGVLNSLIQVGWNSLLFLFTSLSFMDGVFTGITPMFGVPPFVGTLLILLVIVLISFAIFGAIFSRDI